MSQSLLSAAERGRVRYSFEFFPPKSPDMEDQLWTTISHLASWNPDFVSVTYGAGGTTQAPTFDTVCGLIERTPLRAASHLTCVGKTRQEVNAVVEQFRAAGVSRFVALRGDPPSGVGTRYQPHPGGYENAADLVRGLMAIDNFDLSVSAYPEKHPESPDRFADIEMLKRKEDAGARRALTQYFFENDVFEAYLHQARQQGVTLPIVPGIMLIQNLQLLKRFSALCGATVPAWLDDAFAGTEQDPERREAVAADIAARQIADLVRRGVHEFHIYTMNRASLVNRTLERLGFRQILPVKATAA